MKDQMMRAYDFHEYFSENRENQLIALNRAIHLEWKKFVSGEKNINTGIVSPETLKEWERCKGLNINPFGAPQNHLLTGCALEEKINEHQTFINISQPFLHNLFRSLKGFSYTVALFDPDGYMLYAIEEGKGIKYNRMFNFMPGSRWSYDLVGNCAIAYILENKMPKQVIGANHYLNCLHFISSSGEPILNQEGELLGCISVGHFYSDTHPFTRGLAFAAAEAIENEIRAQKAIFQCKIAFEKSDAAFSLQNVVISSFKDALIAVNNDGCIMAVNEKARDIFCLTNQNLSGMPLKAIFKNEENADFFAVVEQHEPVCDVKIGIRTADGVGQFLLTTNTIALSNGTVTGKLLLFSGIKRNKAHIARANGGRANFTFKDICFRNCELRIIMDQARVISQSVSNVLLLGESGTGKDILAQAIHNASPRKDGPYVAINCAAIPRDLIASELFGHAEGAFTGSRRGGSQGKFELADGGTIFLDEIAEIPLDIQSVLLRVIEDKYIVRVGGNEVRSIDVRIISATNRDLLAEVNRGNFRKDLYYRLNVFNLHLPPLKERQDDIPLLTEHFVQKYAKAQGKNVSGVDENVMEVFMNYRWPGNVRELQNVVERMVNYASSDRLTFNLVPPELVDINPTRKQRLDFETPSEKEKRLLRHMLTLKLSKENIAGQLNMSRSTLYRKLKKYGLAQ